MANALTGMPLEEAATATKTDLVYIPGRVVAKDARNIEGRAMTRCLMTGAGMTTVLQAQALKNVRMKSMTNGALRAKTTVMFGTCDDFPDQPTAEGVTDIVGLATVYFVTGTEGLVTICLMTGRVTVITSGTNDVTEITGVGDPPFMSTAAVSLPRPVGTDLGRLAVVIVALINVLIVATLRAHRAVERGATGIGGPLLPPPPSCHGQRRRGRSTGGTQPPAARRQRLVHHVAADSPPCYADGPARGSRPRTGDGRGDEHWKLDVPPASRADLLKRLRDGTHGAGVGQGRVAKQLRRPRGRTSPTSSSGACMLYSAAADESFAGSGIRSARGPGGSATVTHRRGGNTCGGERGNAIASEDTSHGACAAAAGADDAGVIAGDVVDAEVAGGRECGHGGIPAVARQQSPHPVLLHLPAGVGHAAVADGGREGQLARRRLRGKQRPTFADLRAAQRGSGADPPG